MKRGRKRRSLLLIANYSARQLHIIIWHARTSACPFTLRFAILGAYTRVYVSVHEQSVEGCGGKAKPMYPTAWRRPEDYSSFFLSPPLLFFFFSFFFYKPSSSRSFCHRSPFRASLSNPPLSLSNLLAFIAAATWLPVTEVFGRTLGWSRNRFVQGDLISP